jgi:hypothetical protein
VATVAVCFVTTVPDIPVVRLPAIEGDDLGSPAASLWALEVPRARRPSPLSLAALGVLAGVAAMALGAAAVLSAGASTEKSSEEGAARSALQTRSAPAASPLERRVLALLAKPSTERIAFTGSRGLVLAVGSGGRAAILVRGLERAEVGKPYRAWIVAPGAAPTPAGQFVGVERAVFLSRKLGPRASVVVSTTRPAARLEQNRAVAVRR